MENISKELKTALHELEECGATLLSWGDVPTIKDRKTAVAVATELKKLGYHTLYTKYGLKHSKEGEVFAILAVTESRYKSYNYSDNRFYELF